jgi:hypothetical protein
VLGGQIGFGNWGCCQSGPRFQRAQELTGEELKDCGHKAEIALGSCALDIFR